MSQVQRLPDRVLVIGANYWPEESGSAPYTAGLAEDLAAHGVAVTALSAMPHYPQWRIREGYRGKLRVRERHEGVEVVHSWLWVPAHQSAIQRALWEATFLATTLTVRGLERPDVIVASTPSLSGAVAARVLARRWRVPYGLVVQDLVAPGATQSGISGGKTVARAVGAAEKWALSGASKVAIVSRGFEPYLREAGVREERIEHIPNWSHIPRSEADPMEVRRRFGLPEDRPVVLHAGAMGLKQGLDQVVDAARVAQESGSDLCFVLAGDGSRRSALERRARGLDNLMFLPQQPSESYADLLIAADVLLISERPDMVNMSLPSKLTSYVVAGRPIVAAVPTSGATATEIETSGGGITTPAGNPQALADAVRDLLGDPAAVARLSDAGLDYSGLLDRDQVLERLRSWTAELGASK